MHLAAELLKHTDKIKAKEVNCSNKSNATEETFILIPKVVLPQEEDWANSIGKFCFLLCS